MGVGMTHSVDITSMYELVILDVGHGNAALVHEDSATLLVDTAIGSHVLEYLRRRSITAIDVVVLSHADQDHIGGLIGILNAGIRVGSVRLNADAEKASETWRDLVFSLEDARQNGDLEFSVGLSSGPLRVAGFRLCQSEIVSPTPAIAALGVGACDRAGRKITSNSISACIRVLFEKRPVALLASDVDEIALDEVLASGANLDAPVLVFPHHGGLPGVADPATFAGRLLNAVQPATVVFSIGRAKHENPRPEIVSTILKLHPDAHVACTQLSTRCAEVVPATVPNNGVRSVFSAGAAKNICCAGSLIVDLRTSRIAPRILEAHSNFISSAAKTPLCRPRQ